MKKDTQLTHAPAGSAANTLPLDARSAQAALDAKSRLIDNMAYQIRTLSNAIIGFSDLLSSEELTECQKEYVSEIHQAGKALSVLVNDVLDLAKLDSGQLNIAKTYCDLAEQLETLYQMLSPIAQRQNLCFSILADSSVPARIFTDGERLTKCLSSLASNAIKYTDKGHVQISLSIQTIDTTPWIRFDVEDTGCGIPADRLSRIFDEVARMEDANQSVLTSMNMGLSICTSLATTKRLVEALGGRLEAASIVHRGTTFSLLLPAGVALQNETKLDLTPLKAGETPRTKLQPDSISIDNTGTQPTGKHILLVEDQESNRTVITLLLESLGLAVTGVQDGLEAVEITKQKTFDLILMDLMLPRMNGYDATRILRQNKIQIPIIAMSAGVMTEQNSKRIAEDFNALLTKPVDSKKLQQMLNKHLPDLDIGKTTAPATESEDFIIEYN